MTFNEMMKKRFTQPNTSSSPQQKERSQHFPKMMLRSGCYATSVVMSSRRVVRVCDKGVVFAFLLVRRPETGREERKMSFGGAPEKKGFLGRKWNYFRVQAIASRSEPSSSTYPEHQVHQNDEKFNDRTARIHCDFFRFLRLA